MTVLFIVLPLALLASAVALVGFVWSVSRGQLDDLVTPALRMLVDDESRRAAASSDANERAASALETELDASSGRASQRLFREDSRALGPGPEEDPERS